MNIEKFIFAGKAIFTLSNTKTGNRFTYRIKQFKHHNYSHRLYFVYVLTGSDNNNDYTFIGSIFPDSIKSGFKWSKKSRIGRDAMSINAISWFIGNLGRELPECIEVHHEGRCGRCGRRLTVPESIKSGFGSECITKV